MGVNRVFTQCTAGIYEHWLYGKSNGCSYSVLLYIHCMVTPDTTAGGYTLVVYSIL